MDRIFWLIRAVGASQTSGGKRFPTGTFGVGYREKRDDQRRVRRKIERLVEHDMDSVEVGFKSEGCHERRLPSMVTSGKRGNRQDGVVLVEQDVSDGKVLSGASGKEVHWENIPKW